MHAYVYTARDADTLLPIVQRSTDPACEIARELLSRGITGQAKVIDAKTGTHRYTINIEKAAAKSVRENASTGPVFSKWLGEGVAERLRPMQERRKPAA